MEPEYLTLEDYKLFSDLYKTEWEDSKIEVNILFSEAFIKQTFRNNNVDLDKYLALGKTDDLMLKKVLTSLTDRAMKAADDISNETEQDFSQMSQSAGPFSFSLSRASKDQNFFLYKNEKLILGLPNVRIGRINNFSKGE